MNIIFWQTFEADPSSSRRAVHVRDCGFGSDRLSDFSVERRFSFSACGSLSPLRSDSRTVDPVDPRIHHDDLLMEAVANTRP